MGIYEELQARGLIAQVTNEPEIREMVNTGKATFYIGFDPTADSLHVGHFMALCLMKRLQMAGNRPVVLVGGGTGYIGDPSGRTDMRNMMTPETIQHNCDCFKRQMERFIDFGEDKAIMVNNADWLLKLNYIDLLRDVGACFSVNNMLRAGQNLAGVMIQRRHRHRSGVRMAAEFFVADHRQGVGQHRHLMAVLLHVFRGCVPHQRPALDEAHPGEIGEKVTADPHVSASCSTISPNRASPSTSVIRTVRSALCSSAPSTKTSI